MTKTWINRFECQDCLAIIEIRDEEPNWQRPNKELIEMAERWVEEHQHDTWNMLDPMPEDAPAYVVRGLMPTRYEVDPWVYEARWIDCPSCDGRAEPISARDSTPEATESPAAPKEKPRSR